MHPFLGVRTMTCSHQIFNNKNDPSDFYFSRLQIKIGEPIEMLWISLSYRPFIVLMASRTCLDSNCLDRTVIAFFRTTALWSVDRDGLSVGRPRWSKVLKTSGVRTKPREPTKSVIALTAIWKPSSSFTLQTPLRMVLNTRRMEPWVRSKIDMLSAASIRIDYVMTWSMSVLAWKAVPINVSLHHVQ